MHEFFVRPDRSHQRLRDVVLYLHSRIHHRSGKIDYSVREGKDRRMVRCEHGLVHRQRFAVRLFPRGHEEQSATCLSVGFRSGSEVERDSPVSYQDGNGKDSFSVHHSNEEEVLWIGLRRPRRSEQVQDTVQRIECRSQRFLFVHEDNDRRCYDLCLHGEKHSEGLRARAVVCEGFTGRPCVFGVFSHVKNSVFETRGDEGCSDFYSSTRCSVCKDEEQGSEQLPSER